MDDVPLSLIILLVSLILLSAFFSSAETAFSRVNTIRLKSFAGESRKGSKRALYIAENFDKALTTILIGNNIVNIAAASISATLAAVIFGGSTGLIASMVVMTIVILIFGEVLPRSLAKEHAESYTLAISPVLYFLMNVLTPVNYFFTKLKGIVGTYFAKKIPMPSITEEEIKHLLDISEEEGVIDKEERELIYRSMEFDDTLAEEVLTPRIDVAAVEINQPIEEIKQVFFEERYSRIPVYEETIDNIVGVLSEREFLTHLVRYGQVDIKELLMEPYFVVKSRKISSLLPQLQQEKVHMAIVLDEFGGTEGILTLEDVLEEIVGEIWDEQDDKTNAVSKINEHEYAMDARCELDEFADAMHVPHPESSSHTLGGWVIENLKRTPSHGDSFTYENLKLVVDEVTDHRIKKVKVEISEQKEEQVQTNVVYSHRILGEIS
ncbi:hemolysin family protein [Virgibacillus xinjiangensis]|uniref:Hemolysin family protein n=1 Tax=Virgibacillus xinjiangensis TaxID=393090 RepID=A0ABV7CU29_9BACI